MELISVIIPVYNAEPYLHRCIDSVRNQTYQNLEIILVDDGSTDRCPQICDELQMQDSRIQVIHKKNGGQGLARNSGLKIASGAYVTFVDSDDWISKNHIENLYRAAKKSDADSVIGAHTSAYANGTQMRHPIRMAIKCYEGPDLRSEIILPLIGGDVNDPSDVMVDSSCCMNLFRMQIIRDNNIEYRSERVAVAEDLFFNIDFFCCAKSVQTSDESGYYYFENINSTSRKYDPLRFQRSLQFYTDLKKLVAEYGLEKECGYRVERTFLMKIRVAIRLVVMSDLLLKKKMKELRRMLNNPLVQQVVHEYPVCSMVPAIRLLTKFMQTKNILGVYLMIKVRELARQQNVLKILLNKFGIGR